MVAQTPAVLAVKRPFGIVPADTLSEDKMAEMPIGTLIELKPKRGRSLPQMNLYWAVLAEVVKATDAWATSRHLHDAILMDLGYRSVIQRLDGKKYWIPDSIAFSNMKQDEFNEYTDKAFARLAEVVGFDPLAAYHELRGAHSSSQAPATDGGAPPSSPSTPIPADSNKARRADEVAPTRHALPVGGGATARSPSPAHYGDIRQ